MQEQLASLRKRLDSAVQYLNLDDQARQQKELEDQAAEKSLWDDQPKARQVMRELGAISDTLNLHRGLDQELSDLEVLYSLAKESERAGRFTEAQSELKELEIALPEFEKQLDQLELRSLLSGEYDSNDALCRIQSGAGGSDAQNWAEMLYEMYARWAEQNDFVLELNSFQVAESGGLTSAEFIIKGAYAFGKLQGEHGIHRLVRISPYSKEGKRETSFAAMRVLPFIEDLEGSIDIPEKDLKIDTYRSSGPGGQSVNTTDSAVRITHIPTNIQASCQDERSQLQNRERAMEILKAKLLNLEKKNREERLDEITGNEAGVDFANQSRSYFLHPYQKVNDHRTGYKTNQVNDVLGGDLEDFIHAYLHQERSK